MDVYRGEEIQPESERNFWWSDRRMEQAERFESAHPPSCGCKMGADDDPMAV